MVSLRFFAVIGIVFLGFDITVQIVQEAVHFLFDLDRNVVVEGDVVLSLNSRATHESEDCKDESQTCR
tara:strand:- start:139 stop:342 length:204 start_codon:yes stop_codon:yes gene_type:complete